MIDLYSEPPVLYWYTSQRHTYDEYVIVYRKGKMYVGYWEEPEPRTLDYCKLCYVGIGDINWIMEQ